MSVSLAEEMSVRAVWIILAIKLLQGLILLHLYRSVPETYRLWRENR